MKANERAKEGGRGPKRTKEGGKGGRGQKGRERA